MCDQCTAGCPNCWPEREPCPDCEDGCHYFLIDPKEEEYIPCTKEDYDKAPDEYRDMERCETCRGEGWL